MKRIFALVLSAAMILSICLFAGCGEENPPVDNTTTAQSTPEQTTQQQQPNDTTTASSTESTPTQSGDVEQTTAATQGSTPTQSGDAEQTTADTTTANSGEGDGPIDLGNLTGYERLPGYEDVDFGGRVFTIAAFEGSDENGGGRWDNFREVYSDETDAISTSVRNRNAIMEKLYNCKIEVNKSTSPAGVANADITANTHTVDLYCIKGLGTSRYTGDQNYNLLNYGIDFSNPWWDQQFVETFKLKKSSGDEVLYAAVGDFSINAFAATHLMFYNKNFYNRVLSDVDIYQLVRDKKWTVDKFTELIKRSGVAQDVNGNSVFSYAEGDILGWARTDQSSHGIYVAAGLPIITSAGGTMKFAMPEQSAEWAVAIDKAIALANVETAEMIGYTKVQEAIESEKALFASEVLDVLERMKDSPNLSVGLVPYPLYSETQENYAHFVTTTFPAYLMPISVPDPEVIGEFFELYAYHSKYIVRKAFIDTYCIEYCGDEESAEMLDIILNSRTYDPAYVFWSTYETDIQNMITGNKNNVTQWINKKGAKLTEEINTFVGEISDNTN